MVDKKKIKSLLDERLSDPEFEQLFYSMVPSTEFVEQLLAAMHLERLSRDELAVRLNSPKALVTQVLRGGATLTIKTMAKFAWAVGYELHIVLRKRGEQHGPHFLEPLPEWKGE